MKIKIQIWHLVLVACLVCFLGLIFIDDSVQEADRVRTIVEAVDYDKFPPLQFGAYRDKVTGLVYYKNKSNGMWIGESGNVGIGTTRPNNLLFIGER